MQLVGGVSIRKGQRGGIDSATLQCRVELDSWDGGDVRTKDFEGVAYRAGRRLVLATGVTTDRGYVSAPESRKAWLGRTGVTLSPLRPSGTADIDGERVDVVSDGGFIEAGTPIEVTQIDAYRIVVRRSVSRKESST